MVYRYYRDQTLQPSIYSRKYSTISNVYDSLEPLAFKLHDPTPPERSKAEDLEVRLLESEGCSEVLAVEREGLLSKVAALEEECQERCRLSNEWFEGLKVRIVGTVRVGQINY